MTFSVMRLQRPHFIRCGSRIAQGALLLTRNWRLDCGHADGRMPAHGIGCLAGKGKIVTFAANRLCGLFGPVAHCFYVGAVKDRLSASPCKTKLRLETLCAEHARRSCKCRFSNWYGLSADRHAALERVMERTALSNAFRSTNELPSHRSNLLILLPVLYPTIFPYVVEWSA